MFVDSCIHTAVTDPQFACLDVLASKTQHFALIVSVIVASVGGTPKIVLLCIRMRAIYRHHVSSLIQLVSATCCCTSDCPNY